MKKVNEFVNSRNELEERFKVLNTKLYYETAHLSSHHQIRESESYKEILENGVLIKLDLICFQDYFYSCLI